MKHMGKLQACFFWKLEVLCFSLFFKKSFVPENGLHKNTEGIGFFWVPRHHIRVHGVFRSALKGSGINEGDGDFVEGSDVECSEWQSEERSEKNWGGVFKYFYGITPKIGEDSHFDSYFPRG